MYEEDSAKIYEFLGDEKESLRDTITKEPQRERER